jgi:hypothetical protein
MPTRASLKYVIGIRAEIDIARFVKNTPTTGAVVVPVSTRESRGLERTTAEGPGSNRPFGFRRRRA